MIVIMLYCWMKINSWLQRLNHSCTPEISKNFDRPWIIMCFFFRDLRVHHVTIDQAWPNHVCKQNCAIVDPLVLAKHHLRLRKSENDPHLIGSTIPTARKLRGGIGVAQGCGHQALPMAVRNDLTKAQFQIIIKATVNLQKRLWQLDKCQMCLLNFSNERWNVHRINNDRCPPPKKPWLHGSLMAKDLRSARLAQYWCGPSPNIITELRCSCTKCLE